MVHLPIALHRYTVERADLRELSYIGRVAENVIRLATIHAACKQPHNPAFVVELDDVDWAIAFMTVTSNRMVASGRANIGKEDTAAGRHMAKLREFIGQHPMGVTRTAITKKLSGSYGCTTREIGEYLNTICASHEIAKSGSGKKGDPEKYCTL